MGHFLLICSAMIRTVKNVNEQNKEELWQQYVLDKDGTFTLDKAENYSYLYLPVANEKGLKAAVTPDFGGDSKVDQNTFLMEPVSAENLHNNRSTRNFWCRIKGIGSWSVTGASAEAELNRFTEEQEESTLTAGFMWQTVTRSSENMDCLQK